MYNLLRSIVFCFAVLLFWNCQSDSHTNEFQKKGFENAALEALKLFHAQRAYPNNDIPDKSFYRAYEEVRRNYQHKNNFDNRTSPWRAQGPWNVAGRILSLGIDPNNTNTIYAGSASGGLWKSDRLGADTSWQYVETGFPVLGVSAISINPNNSNEMYIGTGEVYNYDRTGQDAAYRMTRGSYGIGILKTENGGKTWEKSLDWTYQQRKGVNALQIDPINPSNIYAATTEGIYKSTDGGQEWNNILDVIMMMDIVIDPNDPNILIASAGNFGTEGQGIYRTVNGGETWIKSESIIDDFNGKARLDIHPTESNNVYLSIGDGFSVNGPTGSWLYRSRNSGLSWELMSTFDYSRWQGWFAHDVGVSPADPDKLIVVGVGTFRSNDGGQTLLFVNNGGNVLGRPDVGVPEAGVSNYVHSDQHVVLYHPDNPEIAFIGSDGGVFMTRDGGRSYQSRNGGLQTTQFYNGISVSLQDENKMMGGLQDNSTVIFRGDKAWEKTLGGDGAYTNINSENDDIVYASAQNLNMYRSNNDARGWFYASPVQEIDNPVFIAPYRLAPSNPDVMYAGTDRVYRSGNGGFTWTATNGGRTINGDPIFSLAISPRNQNTVYVGTAPYNTDMVGDAPTFGGREPAIYKTTNGGISWNNVTRNLPNRYPNDIMIDPKNDDVVYACFSGFGTGHLYKTEDGGRTWRDISKSLPDVPGNAIEIDPLITDFIYYGTDLGMFFSDDGGETWESWKRGLPTAVIAMDLKIHKVPGKRSKIWIATHGHGTYTRPLVKRGFIVRGPKPNGPRGDLAPNPTDGIITLNVESETMNQYDLEVSDVSGKVYLSQQNGTLYPGENRVEVEVYDLNPGTYILSVKTSEGQDSYKFVKI